MLRNGVAAMLTDLLSPLHLVILAIVVLLVFGPKRLPELGSAAAKTFGEFQKAMRELQVDRLTQLIQPQEESGDVAGSQSEGTPGQTR